ncbi:MAG: DNA primase [Lentisphaerae bacterium]|nr:DNA primase [Lentisphaerota bacterium]
MSAEERAAAEAFGRSPDLLERICEDYGRCGLIGEEGNRLLCYLAAVSRRLEHPLSVLILSSSGAGKSALQNVTLGFCPPEDVVRLTSLTGRALFYQDPTSLRHRVLALAETAGGEDAAYAIRSLISEGELVVSTTVRDRSSSRLTTVENRVEGPTAVFCTTTNPEIDPETRSRFFVIGVDESEEQTARVLARQRRRESAPDALREEDVAAVRRLHQTFQRLLRPVRVVNPFAPRLTYGAGRLQSRREQPRYLALINAVAFLRQMSRTARTVCIDGADVDYIEVELDDIAVANQVAAAALGHSIDELSGPARNLLAVLGKLVMERLVQAGLGEDAYGAVIFTRREIREFSGWSHYRVHTHLNELLELQYVLVDIRGPAGPHRYRLAASPFGEMAPMQSLGLKPVERLREEMASAEGGPEVGSVRVRLGSVIDGANHSSEGANDGADGHSVDSEGGGRCAKTPMS